MGDPSHLEKMGRELKCPICLSLLNTAVSLTCNHVFCNFCIMKTTKSGSSCPVCKVPYSRREVRPATHMDNLVSIYKSMEVASGFNIFATQNPYLEKPADDENRVENEINSSERVNKKGTTKRRGSRLAKCTTGNSDPINVKPSFPTKKRVQVPQYTPSDTHIPAAKLGSQLAEITKDEPKRSSVVQKDNYILKERGEPFFWLREEDVEKSSQLTDGDQFFITPPEVPSFSDIKDSDDERSYRDEVHGNTDQMNLFDSEMFEWTQRACSPELLSSPVKMKVGETDKLAVQGANAVEPCISNGTCTETRNDNSAEEVLPDMPSSSKTINNKTGSRKSRGKDRKVGKTAQKKIAKRNTSRVSGNCADAGKGSASFNQNQAPDNSDTSSYLAENRKSCKVVGLDQLETELIAACENAEIPNQDDANMVNMWPSGSGKKKYGDKYENLRTRKSCRRITSHSLRKSCSKSKKKKVSLAKVGFPEELPTIRSQGNEKLTVGNSDLPIPLADDKVAKHSSEGSIKRVREVKSALSLKSEKECKKKMKVSFTNGTKNSLAEEQNLGITNVLTERTEMVQGRPSVGILDGAKELPVPNGAALRKCVTSTSTIRCAFCLCKEDSEASGEMVHYHDGRPVPQDYNGGSKVIHSHKNCTEWAPNVYFENDKAINLEAELSRSRQIKCSCCGLKGAALGCYEKSCRRSFHVPCAKLIPQCRWDTENYVMLCPLHGSSKLPNENSESRKSRKRHILGRHLAVHHNKVPIDSGNSVQKKWSPGTASKLILCCSALTVGEREIISEFEKLSGVTVLKSWDSSVTHIIASTDENGACKRTLKILMGILEGKWILNINWVKACIEAKKPVNELEYEITMDVHGIRDGPRLGRMRLLNKQPKLFDGSKFYIMGDFEPSYRGYLQDLVVAGGGTILHRKPVSDDDQEGQLSGSYVPSTFIIYSIELPDKTDKRKKDTILRRRRSVAEALASSTGAKAVSNSWVLDSISACKLQCFDG